MKEKTPLPQVYTVEKMEFGPGTDPSFVVKGPSSNKYNFPGCYPSFSDENHANFFCWHMNHAYQCGNEKVTS